ncbi:MAG: glycosyltransferase family 2 protein [Kaistella sp.]
MLNISVIIPVYNAASFLQKAVESALQFEEVKEILLIEDGSTDHSLAVCEILEREYNRVQLFQHPDKANRGAGASRNLGLEKASQEFIAFLDADDYYLYNRFEAEKQIFKNEKIEGIFGAIKTEFLSEKGKKEFEEKFKNISLTTVNYAAEGKEIFEGLLCLTPKNFGTFFHLNALTIRASSIRRNNLRFNEQLRVHQDSDFILKLAYHCFLKTGSIEKAVAVRGVHDDNRITKIKLYSDLYNERQFHLWRSLKIWAKENNIEKKYAEYFRLRKVSYEISTKKGSQKYLLLLSEILRNPKILKTRYRFAYLKK